MPNLPGLVAPMVAPGTTVPDETCRPAREAVVSAAVEYVAALAAWNGLGRYDPAVRLRLELAERVLVRAVEALER